MEKNKVSSQKKQKNFRVRQHPKKGANKNSKAQKASLKKLPNIKGNISQFNQKPKMPTKRLNPQKISQSSKSKTQQNRFNFLSQVEEKIINDFPDIDVDGYEVDQIDGALYLDKILKILRRQRSEEQDKNIPVGSVYEGFKTIPIQELDRKTDNNNEKIDGRKIWFQNKDNKVLCYQQNSHLTYRQKNGFFQTLYQAYINHGDLKLTPDDVWLTIMFYFSKYVDNNAEQLRSAFVNHKGKMDLVVETMSADESDWSQFFEKVIKVIRQKTCPGVTQKLECDFSSTNQFSLVMSTALVMNTFKKYFNYIRGGGGCGIVNIHMGGKLEDWQKLENKLYFLRQFDVNGKLKKYVDRLLPVLEQFTQTYKGHAHIEFWNNIYNERPDPYSTGYTPKTLINGWLIRFFTIAESIADTEDAKMSEINVPILFINRINGNKKMFDLVGGCKGVSIEDEHVYRPHFSYAIVENKRQTQKLNYSKK